MNPILLKQDLLNLLGPEESADTQLKRILESPDSEDLLTWNIFWPLAKLGDPLAWAPGLLRTALGRDAPAELVEGLKVRLWHGRKGKEYYPPKEHDGWLRKRMLESNIRHLMDRARRGRRLEGPTEVDIVLESPKLLVFIEAKYLSDISADTSYDLTRDQIARNIDVGTFQAKGREFFFILLTPGYFERSRIYWYKLNDYRGDPKYLASVLPHRVNGDHPVDCKKMAKNIGWLLWHDVISVWKPLLDNAVATTTLSVTKDEVDQVFQNLVSKGLVNGSEGFQGE